MFEIEHHMSNDIYYPYKCSYKYKKEWLERKCTTMEEAIDTCLMNIGITKKERETIKLIYK